MLALLISLRRSSLPAGGLLLALLLTLAVTACGGDSDGNTASAPTNTPPATTALPTATQAAPTATAVPPTPTEAPPAPTATQPPPPPAPTNPPAPQPTAPPPPPPAGVNITVRASGLAFSTGQVSAPAGSRVTATLQNDDATIPHSLQFQFPGAPAANICTGPCSVSQTFTAPAAGSYQFTCTVHPDMTGRFVVN